jgi:tRNA U34 2-thiouridine synthase MnmA/TrmU
MELVTAEKKDSQGLCFIGKFVYGILQQYSKRRRIIQIDKNDSIYAVEEQEDYLKNYCHLRRKNSIHSDMGKW